MPPKKKKTQLKPVARGFATTSQPKKVVQEVVPEPEAESSPAHSSSEPLPEDGKEMDPKSSSAAAIDEFDPEKVEEQSLQNLVDKLQDKTEKEISRTVKSIEVDRRFSQTLSHLEFDATLRDRILDVASAMYAPAATRALEETEEKAIARLGVTYGVLRRLRFSEELAERCLRSINGIELEDAFEWLYSKCSEVELENVNVEPRESKTLKLAVGVTIRKDFTPPPTPRLLPEPLPRKQPVVITPEIPPDPQDFSQEGPETHEGTRVGAKPQVMASYEQEAPSDDDLDDEDPTTAYVKIKLLRDAISSKPRSSTSTNKLQELEKKLDNLSKDYLFDDKEAKQRYLQESQKVGKQRLQERLLSNAPDLESPKPSGPPAGKSKKSTPIAANIEKQDPDSDDSEGMLGFLDNPDATEVTIKGVTVSFRDMALPKHWSGPMPKTLLRDFVAKKDRYAAVSYSTLSKHSRARRAAVVISWQTKQRDQWSMDDIACPDDSQAEQYIATVALHSLTYPLTEGFVASTPASSSSSTSFRLLPAVYRELWDELEALRKASEDRFNRQVWAKLRSILEDKGQNHTKTSDRQQRQAIDKQQVSGVPRVLGENNALSDAVALAFQARQANPGYQYVLAQRNTLPIAQYRNEIVSILETSQVLALSGETGCGKSTQLPSFILEDHLSKGKPCKIYCTEPRRISAISLAQRVSYELCDPPNSVGTPNSLVGYSIRLESNISRNTRLAFVTNGIALRMLEGGSGQGGHGTAFDEVTHIIIDEVHERTIESDFLLIVLKSLLIERPDLKVVLMSATLDAEKISAYFGGCQTLHVPGRTFPVNVQYLEDAIEATKWSIPENSPYARRRKSHPHGLDAFEILKSGKVSDKYYKGKARPEWTEDTQTPDDDDDDKDTKEKSDVELEKKYSPETAATLNMIDERLIPYDLIIRLLEVICYERHDYLPFSAAILIFLPGLGEIRRLNDMLVEHPGFGSNEFMLYPLHSTLSSESQGAVFDLPPSGIRKIVIATNIAETGITIPDITCVIDTGKHREMRFDEKRQISRLVETFVAKSNAAQRRGRAGRVQDGLCFHLFTRIRHDTLMAESPLPEMMRLSLSDLALRIKIMKVKLGASIGDVLSRAMDPPVAINVQRAISMLVEVRALTPSEDITPMGRLLSKLPTDVHLGKFLLIATLFRCLDPALTIAATLNSKSPFVAPMGLEHEADRARASFRIENSDFLTIHNAFSSWRRACSNPGFVRKFCRTNFLSHQNLQQIEDLRQQFLGYLIDSSFIQADKNLLRELSRARYGRNKTRFVAIPADLDINSNNPTLIHAALTAGLYPKILSVYNRKGDMQTITNNQHVSFHPSSVNFRKNPLDFGVDYLTYFTLMHSKKLYAWETGPVDPLALLLLCGDCEHKLVSDALFIDRKIKFCVPPKTNLALKILREQLAGLLAHQYQGKALTSEENIWMDIGLLTLSHAKIKQDNEERVIVK